jgi:hypothetical protein
MFKNRWLLLGLLLLMAACVAVVALAFLPTRPGVTKENFDRIEVGMTRAEVEKIFGGQAPGIVHLWDLLPSQCGWEDDETGDGATIQFDENDCVQAKRWLPSAWPDDRTLWERWLDRLPGRERTARHRTVLRLID